MKRTRRAFLKTMGAGTTGACLSPLLTHGPAAHASVAPQGDGRIKREFMTICRQCLGGCGVLAEVQGGKVKKLRGNPLHPTNRGALCPRGVSALQLYYNPDRIRTPLRRSGARGGGSWEPLSWDEAFAEIGQRLRTLRESGRTHAFAMLVEQLGGLEHTLARRFCEAFGTPNLLDLGPYPAEDFVTAGTVMQGLTGPATFDIRNATFLLSFETPFLEMGRNSAQTSAHFAEFRRGRNRPRGRFIHFSAARDLTASKADEWIPIAPGTEGALALGIAYVMLQEGLYDHDFVKYHSLGFRDWRHGDVELRGFHEHVRRNYKPGHVADVTGVPVKHIVRIAREFALADAPLALWNQRVGVRAQALSTQMAIHSLNALVGNIDASGGVLVPRELPSELPNHVLRDEQSEAGLRRGSVVDGSHTAFPLATRVPWAFPRRVLLRSPYPVEMVLLYRTNPIFVQPGDDFRKALAKIPFSVSISSFHNETTAWCDLILPEHHALESWQAGPGFTDDGYPFFNLCRPVVSPRFDTQHVGDILLRLARECGGTVTKSLPWEEFSDVAAAYTGELAALTSGDFFGRRYQEIWTRLLERLGWRARPLENEAAFWEACLESGGWWDPVYFHREWRKSLRTASARFEFLPVAVLERAQSHAATADTLVGSEGADLLPHHVPASKPPPHEAASLALLVFPLPNLADVESPNQPWLQEITGTQERQQWQTWMELNPHDAHQLGVAHGDTVWLESERGRAQLRCRLDERVQPGTTRVPFGLGHTDGGRWMKGIGVNPAGLLAAARDPQSGVPLWQTTRVQIRKV